MKFQINYLDNLIQFEVKQNSIPIRDLKCSLKTALYSYREKDPFNKIFNQEYDLRLYLKATAPKELNDSDYIKNQDSTALVEITMFPLRKIHPGRTDPLLGGVKIEEAIQKVTGAKEPLKVTKNKHGSMPYVDFRNNFEMEIIDTLMQVRNRNMPSDQRIDMINRLMLPLLNSGSSLGMMGSMNSGGLSSSVQPNQTSVNNLKDMGFSEDRARRALTMSHNDENAAVEILLADHDLAETEPQDLNDYSQSMNDGEGDEDI